MYTSRRLAPNEYDLKVVVVGKYGVGKSTLLHRFIYGTYSAYVKPNARVETEDLRMTREDNYVRLRLWDTAGQERFRSLTNSYYRDTNAVILTFDVTNEKSYRDLDHWYDDVKTLVQPNGKEILVVVAGTKCHMTEKREVSTEDGYKFAMEKRLEYKEVSAEEGTGVVALFETVVDILVNQQEELRSSRSENKILVPPEEKKRSQCCLHG